MGKYSKTGSKRCDYNEGDNYYDDDDEGGNDDETLTDIAVIKPLSVQER